MKKLFRNIALLLLIYIVISQVAVNSLPFSWGNTRLNTKYEEFKSRVGDFNTIFIGASTTYRHIDPTILIQDWLKRNQTGIYILLILVFRPTEHHNRSMPSKI